MLGRAVQPRCGQQTQISNRLRLISKNLKESKRLRRHSMQKILTGLSLAILCAALSGVAWADTLIMKDGTSPHGEFVSGTSRVITFRENGEIERFGIEDIDALQFGAPDQGPRSEAPQGNS